MSSAIGLTNDQTCDNLLVKFKATIGTLVVTTFNNPLLTAKGSILTSDGTNNVALALGPNRSHLEVDTSTASGLAWVLSDGFAAQFQTTTTQSIPTSTTTQVTGGTDGWITTGLGNFNRGNFNLTTGVFTCVTPGAYIFTGSLSYDVGVTGYRICELQLSFNTRAESQISGTGATTGAAPSTSCVVMMAVGDTFKMNAEQNSGAALNINSLSTHFSGYRLG
jgi:hypothetical protein